MSNRDRLIDEMMRKQLEQFNPARRLQQQALEQQERLLRGAAGPALEAFTRNANEINRRYMESVTRPLHSTQLQMLYDLQLPRINERMAEIVRQTLSPLSQVYSLQAARMAGVINQGLRANQTVMGGLASAVLRASDLSKIRGDSLQTAYASLLAAQAKGYESLRESFAGIVANALRQGFEDLEERDEQALARFEQIIDDKVTALPKNEVTAESLWKYLIMLLITLAGPGLTAYQIMDAKKLSETQSKTQAEQQIKQDHVIALLERIAESVSKLIPDQDQNVYYVVERRVDLKLKPNFKTLTIATLHPNQKVRLEKMSHKWIYIEYFDYLEGVPKYGWASKKYFKRISG